MMTAILSLSLLTVMAGAAVAPALGTIREHFSDSPDTVVQLIISMPATLTAHTAVISRVIHIVVFALKEICFIFPP